MVRWDWIIKDLKENYWKSEEISEEVFQGINELVNLVIKEVLEERTGTLIDNMKNILEGEIKKMEFKTFEDVGELIKAINKIDLDRLKRGF